MAKPKHNNQPRTDHLAQARQPALLQVLVASALAAITLTAYWQVNTFEFTHFDDQVYVARNTNVLAGLTWRGIAWAFEPFHTTNWHPLTWISLMFDAQFAGRHAGFYHVHNVALHIAATLLLFALLSRMTGFLWRSAFVAALFAIHPAHVESVAWIAERKDVLSTVFWMLTTWIYVVYCARPTRTRYAAMLAAFALGLLAKPMLVTLPLTLLMLDFWPLRRHIAARALVIEKTPLVALSIGSYIITVLSQRAGGSVAGLSTMSLAERIGNAAVSYAAYIGKLFWPANLVFFYPMPHSGQSASIIAASAVVLVLISIAAVKLRRQQPYLLAGWLWYVVTLLPVIGIVQVGSQAMADRYTYIPFIGLFVAIAWAVPEMVPTRFHRPFAIPALILIAVLGVVTTRQVGYWRSSFTLTEHALAVASPNHVAHFVAGEAHAAAGRFDRAIYHYNRALLIKPADDRTHDGLAQALLQMSDVAGAVEHARQAVNLEPKSPVNRANLGKALLAAGELEQASDEFEEALRLQPDLSVARNNLAYVLIQLGRIDDAQAEVRRVLDSNPNDADAHNNQGMIDLNHSDSASAEEHFRTAIRLDGTLAEAHNNLGYALVQQGRIAEAIEEFRQAVKLNPGKDYFRKNLAQAQRLLRQL